MDWVGPIAACTTCVGLGALVTWVVMKNQCDQLETRIDGMMDTIHAYQRIQGSSRAASAAAVVPNIYAPEPVNPVWLEHIADPVMSDVAVALGLIEDGDEYEIVDGTGAVVHTFKNVWSRH